MLLARMLRAARFDRRLYEELRGDPIASLQAVAIMLIAAIALLGGSALLGAIMRAPTGLVGIFLLNMATKWLLVMVSLFFLGGLARANDPERGSDRDLLIAIGFASSPGILWLVPHPLVADLVWGWMVAAMIIGSQAILRVSLFRAITFVLPGMLLYLLLFFLVENYGGGG